MLMANSSAQVNCVVFMIVSIVLERISIARPASTTGDTGITGMKRGAIIAHCLTPVIPVSPVVNQSLPYTDSKSDLLFKRVNCDLWYLRRLNKTCGFA